MSGSRPYLACGGRTDEYGLAVHAESNTHWVSRKTHENNRVIVMWFTEQAFGTLNAIKNGLNVNANSL